MKHGVTNFQDCITTFLTELGLGEFGHREEM